MEEPPKHPDVARIFTQLLDTLGMNAAQFARKIGSTPQAVSNYMVGRNEPGRKMLALIIEAYPNIDAAWLASGKGEPFPNGRVLAHGKPTGEARTAIMHPTIQPADKELTSGTPTGPTMFVNDTGTLEGHWKMIAEERAARLADKDQEIERLMQQLEAWQEAFRKPLASAEAAAHLTFSTSAPIGPRFDSAPANMWVNRDSQEIQEADKKAA